MNVFFFCDGKLFCAQKKRVKFFGVPDFEACLLVFQLSFI